MFVLVKKKPSRPAHNIVFTKYLRCIKHVRPAKQNVRESRLIQKLSRTFKIVHSACLSLKDKMKKK